MKEEEDEEEGWVELGCCGGGALHDATDEERRWRTLNLTALR